LLWQGFNFMAYIVLVSGVLMTLSYVISVFYVLRELFIASVEQ
jgi:hypothetical protein